MSKWLYGDLPVVKVTKQEIGEAVELLCPECGLDLDEIVKGEVAECKKDKILFAIGREDGV